VLTAAAFVGKSVQHVDRSLNLTESECLKLVTPEGSLTQSNAILRFLARGSDSLYGSSVYENAEVDNWLDWSALDLEPAVCQVLFPIFGVSGFNAQMNERATNDCKKSFSQLNARLESRTFLVGSNLSVADVAVASALVYPFRFCFDAAVRNTFPHLVRWFTHVAG